MFAKKCETGHRDLANLLAHRQKLLSQELDDLKNKASVFNHEDHWYVAHNLKFELAFNLAKEGLLTNPMEMDKISQDDSFYFPPALEAEDVFKTYYTFVCGLEECNPSNKLSVRELYEQVCLGLASYMFLAAKEARRADNDFLTAASVAYADWLVEIDCRFLKSLQEQEFNWKRSAANFQIPELLKPELVPVLDATRRQRIIERGEENNV
jgi:hypothetical protein